MNIDVDYYISKYEKRIILNELKKLDINLFVNLFIFNDFTILRDISYDLFTIKETNRLIFKNVSNLFMNLLMKEDRDNLMYNLKMIFNSMKYTNWYKFLSMYFKIFFKTLDDYYRKKKIYNKKNKYYILKLWSILINKIFSILY